MNNKKPIFSFDHKNKKAQEVMGMSFNMIFSIMLIVFFIVVAFIVIKQFMVSQNDTQIGMFIDKVKTTVDKAFYSNDANTLPVNATLPAGVEYVCFANMTAAVKNASAIDKLIYNGIRNSSWDAKKNFYIYAPSKDFAIKSLEIKFIDLSLKNPICIPVKNGKVSFKIDRRFENPYVTIIP